MKTLEHFFSSPDIFSDPVHRAAPHTASSQHNRGSATTLRHCRQQLKGQPHHAPPGTPPSPSSTTDPREKPHARAKRETLFQQLILPECNGVCSKEGLDLHKGNSKSKWLGERRHRIPLSSSLQLQQVTCKTEGTSLGPI